MSKVHFASRFSTYNC